MKTLNTNDISTLSIKVTEEIAKRNIHTFLKTAISNSDLFFSKNTYYYYYYNSNTFIYEIIFYEKSSETTTLEPFLIAQKLNQNDDVIKIFLVVDYFIVSKNNKLLIFKKVNTIDVEEISLYVNQMYKIEEFEIIEITQEYIDSLLDEKKTLLNDEFYPLYPKKSFYVFSAFVTISSLIFILMLYLVYYKEEHVKIAKKVHTKVHRVSSNNSIDKIIELFEYIKLNDITIDNVFSSNKKIKTILYHPQKSQLLTFANTYKKNFNIKLLKYDDIKRMYIMEIIVEY